MHKVVATNLKENLDEISSSTNFSAKNINELNKYVASAYKSAKTNIRKLGSLANK